MSDKEIPIVASSVDTSESPLERFLAANNGNHSDEDETSQKVSEPPIITFDGHTVSKGPFFHRERRELSFKPLQLIPGIIDRDDND